MEAIIISNPQSQFNTQNNLPINLERIINYYNAARSISLVSTNHQSTTDQYYYGHMHILYNPYLNTEH